MSKEKAHVEEPVEEVAPVVKATAPAKVESHAAIALREVAAIIRIHGSFNDLSVNRAFASMAELLEKRAKEL